MSLGLNVNHTLRHFFLLRTRQGSNGQSNKRRSHTLFFSRIDV